MSQHKWIAAELLLICTLRETLWSIAPVQSMGNVSKILGASMSLVLLDIIRRLTIDTQCRELTAVLWLAMSYQALTMIGFTAYILYPWNVPEGKGVLSALIGMDTGALWLMAVCAIAVSLDRKISVFQRD